MNIYEWAHGLFGLCSSSALPLGSKPYRTIYHTMPLHCIPCQGVSLCEQSSAFVESVPKCTSEVPIRYTLHPTRCVTHCSPMVHSVGLSSGAQRGTLRFTLACSGPHGEVVHHGFLPDRVRYGYSSP